MSSHSSPWLLQKRSERDVSGRQRERERGSNCRTTADHGRVPPQARNFPRGLRQVSHAPVSISSSSMRPIKIDMCKNPTTPALSCACHDEAEFTPQTCCPRSCRLRQTGERHGGWDEGNNLAPPSGPPPQACLGDLSRFKWVDLKEISELRKHKSCSLP